MINLNKNNSKDLGVGLFLVFFSVFLYMMSITIKVSKAETLGPQFLPKIISVLLGILSLILIKNAIKNRKNVIKKEKLEKELNLPLLLSILLLLFYITTINFIGFILVSIIYLFLQIRILSLGKPIVKKEIIIEIIVSIVVPILIYFLFYKIFNIFLPMGIFE